ncbi:hypothetical protein IIV22A_167R [Invertebrate iridescent virus 22]|uniref:Resolvase HTH domain-containing protein n=1 Tax=Invertebrate iridescent virus 22 TaxID=345198 RepID=W8W209_9VIRU|nr:hypothetical protein IIV22A_167R [Invertebrate iridescent virus 22]CCV02011.1 hypothetical protein IIV22A_167R [Invertebrate iridescent virus 22]
MIRPRLTKEQRNEIVNLYTSGTPIVQLSRQFKVTRPTIYNVIESQGNTNHKKIDFYSEKVDENKDMSELNFTVKTDFLGVTIDTENGSSNPKINKALSASFQLLDIMEFVKVTKFKLNMTMFDYFWQVVVGNQSTLVGRLVLEWFGYDGEYFKQKQNFKKMLKNNNIQYHELTKDNKEIEQYPTFQQELQLLPHNGARTCSKFLIMQPKDLKMAIMQLKTKNGHIIREYYIDLEELLKLYTEYTLYFNHRESQRKITDLEQMMADLKVTNKNIEESNKKLEESNQRQEQYMRSLGISLEEVKDQNEELLDSNITLKQEVKKVQHKLGIAVKDRAPLPVDEDKQERFVLIKRNDPDYYPYYTIRAQEGYTNRKLRVEQLHFPNLEVLLDFKCNPNSKSLYTRIKENLKAEGVIFKGNNIDLEDSHTTEKEFIKKMKVINNQKLYV